MQEWDVVGVIAVLVALFSAAVAPMLKLAQAISRLTATVEQLEKMLLVGVRHSHAVVRTAHHCAYRAPCR